jgi:hypothetical protein
VISYKLDEHPTKHVVLVSRTGFFGKNESYCRDILKKECMILMPCHPLRRWCLNPSLASEIWVEHRLHLAPGRSPCAPAQYMGDVACCCLCACKGNKSICVSVVTFFLCFSEDDVRMLASSSFQVFFGGFWFTRGGDEKRNSTPRLNSDESRCTSGMHPSNVVGTYFVMRLRRPVVAEAHVERAIRTVHFAKMGS